MYCPFPINFQFNAHCALWIINSLIKNELDGISRLAKLIFCVRGNIDTIIYAESTGSLVGHQMKNLQKMAEDWMDTYDKIYYIRPGDNLAIPDGIRSTDENFRKKVEDNFDDWMERCNMAIQNKIVIIKSEDIFAKQNCWLKSESVV